MLSSNRIAVVGLAMLVAPLSFAASGVLETRFGLDFMSQPWRYFVDDPDRFGMVNLVSPILFFAALMVALRTNLLTVSRLSIRREKGAVVGTITIHPKVWNLSVIVLASALLAAMLTYAVLGNLTPHG